MIPKVIHLCWLSRDEYPAKIKYCISTWKKHLPDYEIRIWNTDSFDLNSSLWCKEAYDAKKYAFAADFIRCYALYTEGGIYLDSDVEVLRSFDDLLHLPYFIGEEQGSNLEPAVMGCEKGWIYLSQILDYYQNRHFIANGNCDLTTLPQIMSEQAKSNFSYKRIAHPTQFDFSRDTICVLPAEYFSPRFPNEYRCPITSNTYTVHHFAASWYPIEKKIYRKVRQIFGYGFASFMSRLAKNTFKYFQKKN